jgi:hypothetical protein
MVAEAEERLHGLRLLLLVELAELVAEEEEGMGGALMFPHSVV